MKITVYDAKGERQAQPAELPDLLQQKGDTLWIDMSGPTADDVQVMEQIFHFHPLAIEDTRNHRQRSKMEEFPDHLFMILNPVGITGVSLEFRELDVFVGGNYLVTVHQADELALDDACQRIENRSTNIPMSSSYLLYVIVDTIVDEYFPTLDTIGERLERLEDLILARPHTDALRRISQLKRMLIEMWRVVWPQRHVINTLTRRDLTMIDHDALEYHLRDVSDHLLWAADIVQTFRDTLTGVMDLYMSATSNRLSRVINRLSVITVIVGMLTVISAFYGMNFTQTWPSYNSPWGFAFAVGLMASVTGIALLVFRRLGWY